MGDDGAEKEDDDGDRHGEYPALSPPGEIRLEARDRAARREEKCSTSEDRHAAQCHHESRHLESCDRHALDGAAREAHEDRCQRCKRPAIAQGLVAHREAVLQAALGDGGADEASEGKQRSDG